MGMSGSGKSTLLAMIAGLVEPTAGRICMGGRPLGEVPASERLARIGLLTQRTELFRDSIAENLRVAAPEADDAQLWAALAAVELDAKVRGLPGGLEARLGEGGAGLSGGEARRLALARIVLKSPPVWLLDEPTAGPGRGPRRQGDGQPDAPGRQRNRDRRGPPWPRGRFADRVVRDQAVAGSCARRRRELGRGRGGSWNSTS